MGAELQGDGETIRVRVEVPKRYEALLADTATVFSRARFIDGSEAGVRVHLLRAVEGQDRLGVLEVRTGEPPASLWMGDLIVLTAGGEMVIQCWVAEH